MRRVSRASCWGSVLPSRGLTPASKCASVGWVSNMGTCGLIRKSNSRVVALRAGGGFSEQDYKQYGYGNPKLYENWQGKQPNAWEEEADLGPLHDNHHKTMYVDKYPELGSGYKQMLQLVGALATIGGVIYAITTYGEYLRPKFAIHRPYDERTFPTDTMAAFQRILDPEPLYRKLPPHEQKEKGVTFARY